MKASAEVRQERSELIDRCDAIVKDMEKRKRNMTDEEKQVFESALNKIGVLNLRIAEAEFEERSERDRFEGRSSTGGQTGGLKVDRQSQAEFAVLDNGDRIPLVLPGQSIRSAITHGSTEQGQPRLSLARIVRGMVTGNWRGADAERRSVSEGSGADGGYLVQEILSSEFIDLARNQSVIVQAGARTIPLDAAEVRIARLDSDPESHFHGENQEIAEDTAMKIGAYYLRPRTLAALITCPVELVEDAINLDEIIRGSLAAALALEIDRSALYGDATGITIRGLRTWTEGTPAINVVDMGTNGAELTSYDKLSEAFEKVLSKNGNPTSAIYSPRTFGTLDRLTDQTDAPLAPPPSWAGLQKFITNQVPEDLVHGSADDSSEVWVGDFSKMLIGVRTQLQIEASRTAGDAFKKLQVAIRAYLRADIIPTYPQHFSVVSGIIPPSA